MYIFDIAEEFCSDDFEDDVHVDKVLSELIGMEDEEDFESFDDKFVHVTRTRVEGLRISEDFLVTDDGFKGFNADIQEYIG
ncbi:hypothetical protein V1522DRAFT_425263 [Lipomyces starkeyi]